MPSSLAVHPHRMDLSHRSTHFADIPGLLGKNQDGEYRGTLVF